jgi:hypothetical protein
LYPNFGPNNWNPLLHIRIEQQLWFCGILCKPKMRRRIRPPECCSTADGRYIRCLKRSRNILGKRDREVDDGDKYRNDRPAQTGVLQRDTSSASSSPAYVYLVIGAIVIVAAKNRM